MLGFHLPVFLFRLQPAANLAGGPPPPMPDWEISKTEQAQYSTIFTKMDNDMDGLVTGLDVRDFFNRSNLPQSVLARIWDLVDIQRTGYLNQWVFLKSLVTAV